MIRPLQETRTFETEFGPMAIVLHDILWVDGTCKDVTASARLHLNNQVVTCKNTFEELLPLLGDAFLFCLTRGAVNQLRIRRFETKQIVFDTGESVPVDPFLSSRYREKYCRDMACQVWED